MQFLSPPHNGQRGHDVCRRQSGQAGSSLTTGNMNPIASFDTDEVEITYSFAHDGPQSYYSEPAKFPRNHEQARMGRNNDQWPQIEL